MSNDEAKFLLGAYRPGGQDANDPALAGALEQARRDPEVSVWFAREQAHAAAVAAKLREIVPPSGLRDAILAGGRATRRAASPAAKSHWTLRNWAAVAAAVVALAAVTALFFPRNAVSATDLVAFAIRDVEVGRHGGRGADAAALQQRLGDSAVPLTAILADTDALKRTGCRTLRLAGRDVVEVCFERNGTEWHWYALRASRPWRAVRDGPLVFQQHGDMSAAAWTVGEDQIVVVGKASVAALRAVVGS